MYFIIRRCLPRRFSYGEELGKHVAVLWESSHVEFNLSKAAMELCRHHAPAREFSWIKSFST